MVTTIGTDIDLAVKLLNEGRLVAIPTETVYGLAGNATNPEAVAGIFEAKQRPRFNPLIMHLPSLDAAEKYVDSVPDIIRTLATHFSPGPISYLLPKSSLVPDIITAGSDKVVIRIPSHPMTLELLSRLEFPLAAPSANPFGYVSPVTAQHVYDGLHGKIPYILDGGPCLIGLESTIVGWENDELVIHRVGGVSADEIEKVSGVRPRYNLLHEKPDTPGQMKSHYAPKIPLLVGDPSSLIRIHQSKKVAVISLSKIYQGAWVNMPLSKPGNLIEAAANLFTVLRELDHSDIELIIAERFPEEGIGIAINDRLSRAVS